MITHLEISGRQTGKTRRLVEALKTRVNNITSAKRIAVIGERKDIVDREIKIHLSSFQNSKIVYVTNFQMMRGCNFDSIFVDEFDYVKKETINNAIDVYSNFSDFYFNTTPRKFRTREEILNTNNDDPLVRILRLNNYCYHRHTRDQNSHYENYMHIPETEHGIFMEHNNETSELATRWTNTQPFLYVEAESFISGVAFVHETIRTSSLAEVNESGRAMQLRLRDNSTNMGQFNDLQNAFDELVNQEVQRRLKNLEQINIDQKRVSNIGGDLGKRQIEA